MSGTFSFPPPPPPPPKASGPPSSQQGGGYPHYVGRQDRGRGRGGPRGGHSQRGRGQYPWRGNHSPASHQQPPNPRHYGNQQNTLLQNHSPVAVYQQHGQYQQSTEPLPPGAFVNPKFSNQRSASYFAPSNVQSNPYAQQQGDIGAGSYTLAKATSPPRTSAGHKRKLDALRGPQQERVKKPGPQTAPAVPSFGASIFPPKVELPAKSSNEGHANGLKNKPASRGLGLTPAGDNVQYAESGSEDEKEVDEETMYAELGGKLTFDHNGVVISLKSQADLIAWKKERQKNWPTMARMTEKEEARRRVGQERKRLLAAAETLPYGFQKGSSKWSSRQDARSHGERSSSKPDDFNKGFQASENPAAGVEGLTGLGRAKAELHDQTKKLEELRKKVAQSEAKNRKAKAQKDHDDSVATSFEIEAQNSGVPEVVVVEDGLNLPTEAQIADEKASGISDEASDSSSSTISSDSTSESDSEDDAPEEIASKPPVAALPASEISSCRYFAASGYCRDGDACRFKHERLSEAPSAQGQPQGQQRVDQQIGRTPRPLPPQQLSEKKSIFQRMVEQEQNEEDRLTLQVIKYLGKAGFFGEHSAIEEP